MLVDQDYPMPKEYTHTLALRPLFHILDSGKPQGGSQVLEGKSASGIVSVVVLGLKNVTAVSSTGEPHIQPHVLY